MFTLFFRFAELAVTGAGYANATENSVERMPIFTGTFPGVLVCGSSLRSHVCVVIGVGPGEQMLCTDTSPTIAPMKNQAPRRNPTMNQPINKPMDKNCSLSSAPEPNNSISTVILGSRPEDAT